MPLEREKKNFFRECKVWTYGWKSPPLFFFSPSGSSELTTFSQLAKDATKVDELPKLSSLKSETF